ncbi:MAG: hypothetical protein M1821_003514 [Bathelium mastoideum]|nr:MAG: hypothetical protein M1821_003514 [Bathelium mastoideum]
MTSNSNDPPTTHSSSTLDDPSTPNPATDPRYTSPCQFCLIAAAHPPPSSPHPDASWISSAPFPATSSSPSSSSSQLPFQNHTLLSTPHLLAFLDTFRMSPGHLLLIPRSHHATLADVPPGTAAQLGRWLPVLSRVVCGATGAHDWNVLGNNGVAAGQTVGHAHVHLVPRGDVGEKDQEGKRRWRWRPREEFDEEEGEEMVQEMRRVLRVEIERMGRERL